MKCVIVSSKTLAKYNRWDAAFYCGTLGKEAREEIERRKERLAVEQRRIAEAEALEQQANQRHQAMMDSGEIKPL